MGFRSTRGLLLVSLGLGVTLSCSAGESDNVRDDAGAAGTVVTPSAGAPSAGAPSAGAPASSAGAGVGGAAHGGASTGGATTGGAGAGLSGGAGVTGGGSSAGGASAGAAGTSGSGVGGAASGAGGAGAGGLSGSGAGGGGASGAGASGAGAGGGGASGAGAGGAGASGAGAGGAGASGAGAGGSGGAGSVGTSYTLDKFVINGQPASTISGSAKVTWSATKIQFFFNIKDATPFDDSANNWEDDAVEIYLDMNHAKSAAYQADDVQIIVPRAAGTLSGIGTVTFASITVVRAEVTGGYTLDVSVPWAALNNSGSQLGKTIGIDIGVDDDLNGGTRDAQLMLVGTDQAYQNTSFFADLTLN